MALTSSRLTSAPALAGALIIVTALAAGPLQGIDEQLQGYWAKKYTPNWANFLDSVPNAVAGQAVCLPLLLGVALFLAWRHRTWHPLVIVAAAEVAFYAGIGGMKVLLGRTAPAAGEGAFWEGGAIEHGWYGIAYPSGHAAEAILIYGAAAYLLRTYAASDRRLHTRLNWLVGLITVNAIVVAFYLGYHWPSDLVGGMIAGALMLRIIVDVDRSVTVRKLVAGWRRRLSAALAPQPARPAQPALARTVSASTATTSTTTAKAAREELPDMVPVALGADAFLSRRDRPLSPPFAVRTHQPAPRRELQTAGRG